MRNSEQATPAGDYRCKQCLLSDGRRTYTAWIPEKFAIEGKIIDIDDDETGSKGRWVVKEVGKASSPYSYVNDRSQDHKRTRKTSDI